MRINVKVSELQHITELLVFFELYFHKNDKFIFSENVCDDWESTDVDGGGGTTIMSEQMRRVLKERERVKKVEEKVILI